MSSLGYAVEMSQTILSLAVGTNRAYGTFLDTYHACSGLGQLAHWSFSSWIVLQGAVGLIEIYFHVGTEISSSNSIDQWNIKWVVGLADCCSLSNQLFLYYVCLLFLLAHVVIKGRRSRILFSLPLRPQAHLCQRQLIQPHRPLRLRRQQVRQPHTIPQRLQLQIPSGRRLKFGIFMRRMWSNGATRSIGLPTNMVSV
jgi:hypothetical protein